MLVTFWVAGSVKNGPFIATSKKKSLVRTEIPQEWKQGDSRKILICDADFPRAGEGKGMFRVGLEAAVTAVKDLCSLCPSNNMGWIPILCASISSVSFLPFPSRVGHYKPGISLIYLLLIVPNFAQGGKAWLEGILGMLRPSCAAASLSFSCIDSANVSPARCHLKYLPRKKQPNCHIIQQLLSVPAPAEKQNSARMSWNVLYKSLIKFIMKITGD